MRLYNYLNEFDFRKETHAKGVKAGYDKTLAKALVMINRKGYPTFSSHSGIKYDHKEKSVSPSGYISFVIDELTPEQIKKIKSAVKKPFWQDKGGAKLLTIRLWGKVKDDPTSEDQTPEYIKSQWINFAKKL
jgi:hypothetical protein